MWYITKNNGQAMLLTTIMIGGIFLMATAVAGLLMFYQLQQSTDFGNSTIAIFAADAALENAVNEYFNNPYFTYNPDSPNCSYPDPCPLKPSITLSNGATGEAELIIPPPAIPNARTIITATGKDAAQRTVRLLQTTFLITPSL